MSRCILLTGAAGYIGGMLCDTFARRADVACIVALDKEPMPTALRGNPKLRWITANTADGSWQAAAAAAKPDIVIHAAWQIREMYGQQATQRRWNIDGSDAVFDFAFETPSVRRLLHFSSVAPYGAFAGNSIARPFVESDALRVSDFRYAEEKRAAEECLARKAAQARGRDVAVVVLRPATLAGPRGRERRAGLLQTALSARGQGHPLAKLLALVGSLVPVTPKWCRQYLHEDDLVAAVALLALGRLERRFDVFNICPSRAVLRGTELAALFGTRPITVRPSLVRFAFFLLWHGSRGRITTPRGAWRSYSYPVLVDAGKLTATYGFEYRMSAVEALSGVTGRYSETALSGTEQPRLQPAE